MAPSVKTLIAFLLSGVSASLNGAYRKNGLKWSSNSVRMNQIQVIGTHNSYHREATPEEKALRASFSADAQNLEYSHPALDIQLSYQAIRNLELDIFADPEGGHYAKPLIRANLSSEPLPGMDSPGIKVLHIADLDYHTTCRTFIGCLSILKSWSDAHPDHVPIPIMTEFKTSETALVPFGGSKPIPWNNATLLQGLDDEIRSALGEKKLIVPDDIRRPGLTLEQSVLKYGWPDLDSARGRFFFLMDNGPVHPIRDAYTADRPNLEGRVLFTNSAPGNSDCAFQKLNDPTGDNQVNIQKQVKEGYWVRTRADVPLETLFSNDTTAMREAAFSSGAQIVSTDFQAYGMSSRWDIDYAVRFEGGITARCNPVSASHVCKNQKLEKEAYSRP